MSTKEGKAESYIPLDMTLTTAEERCEKVKEIIAATPPEKLNSYYLERLADYILLLDLTKKKRNANGEKEGILTNNRVNGTINKREISFEGLVGKLENGEDGIYSMIADNKNQLLTQKDPITEEEIKTIPGMQELTDEIKRLETALAGATSPKARGTLKKTIIQLYQDRYVLRSTYRPTIKNTGQSFAKQLSHLDLSDKIDFDEKGNPVNHGIISFFNYKHISLLLCNYSKLKQESWDDFKSDVKYMMEDLDEVVELALADFPILHDILVYKIDGKSNIEIQKQIDKDYGVKHSVEYISSLWRNKIPKMIADKASEEYLLWHFTNVERGKWKKCSRCGEIKLAHNRFFSKNKSSKDGFYSICKCCRNKKK